MTGNYNRYEPYKERTRSKGREEGAGGEKSRKDHKTLLTGDPLGWLISLHPALVAFAFIVLGWGSILLIAWRLEVITSEFLRNPAFMVGDLVILPLCGALIAAFYRSASLEMPSEWGTRIAVGSAAIASIAAGATAVFSIFVTDTYLGWWSAPHTLFIWLFAYVFVSFLPRAFTDITFYLRTRKIYHLMAVIALPAAHISTKSFFGGTLS